MAGGRTSVRKSKYPLKGVLDTTVRVGLATAQAEANKAKEKVMSKLTEAIANAVVESDSFMGSFSYNRNPDGSIGDVLVMVSDGQASGSPEVGSGVLVVEKKSKVQFVTLTELVTTKTVMGVGASLWKFTNDTANLKR